MKQVKRKPTAVSDGIGAPGDAVDNGDKEWVSPVVAAARKGEEVTVKMETVEPETTDD